MAPPRFTAFANATSSMSAPLIDANQHGTAGGCGNSRLRIVHPGEGIQHLKEIHEGRHQRAFSAARTIEPHHLAHHVDPRCVEARDERCQMPWIVHDVCIGQQQDRCAGERDALTHCP
jgi:hypothetical protein